MLDKEMLFFLVSRKTVLSYETRIVYGFSEINVDDKFV